MNATAMMFGFLLIGIVACSLYFYKVTKENTYLIKSLLKISQDRESYRLLLEDLVEVFDSGVDTEQCPAMLKKFSNCANKLLTEGVNDGKRRKQKTKIDCY